MVWKWVIAVTSLGLKEVKEAAPMVMKEGIKKE